MKQATDSGEKVVSLTRRLPAIFQNSTPDNVTAIIEPKSELWSDKIKQNDLPSGSTFFSAFGTTKAAAGSAERFKQIDYGINIESFKAAKESGKFDKAILVSSMGANEHSSFLYMKTKGELERDVKALGFKTTVILQPGILLGHREVSKGWNNSMAEKVGGFLRGTFMDGVIGHPIRGEEVAKAAFVISQAENLPEGVLVVTSKEMRQISETGKYPL